VKTSEVATWDHSGDIPR